MIGLKTKSTLNPVMPLGVTLTVLYVGFHRLFLLVVLAWYPPNLDQPVNTQMLFSFWEFWHESSGWAGSVQSAAMVINILLVLFLWAQFRGLPRCSFGQRSLQLLAFGGAAGLLTYLQYYLACLSLVEPAFRLIRLDVSSSILSSP